MANYVLIDSIQISGSATASSITFSNIPQTGYTDLKLVYSLRSSASVGVNYEHPTITFNGGGGTFKNRMLYANGQSILAADDSGGTSTVGYWQGVFNTSNSASNSFSSCELYIPNYAGSAMKAWYSSGSTGNNLSGGSYWGISDTSSSWSSSSAITSITLSPSTGSFIAGSSVAMYGIAATGTTPVAAKAYGGDTVITDGTYWYHAFLSSGTFTATQALSCDILTIAGGGGVGYSGAGNGASGGGGAGGLVYLSSQSIVAGSNTVTVGAGGNTSGTYSSPSLSNGNNSQFGLLTAAVGGGAGGPADTAGQSGGSGGGAGMRTGGLTPAAGTAGQGNAGGLGYTGGSSPAGGGGGAGASGGNASSGTGGVGGAGVNTYSAWATATSTGASGYFAGGGGGQSWYGGSGGAGGSGGGGAGRNGSDGSGTAGTVNTGGGAGGGNYGANGGSGIVIVRYAV